MQRHKGAHFRSGLFEDEGCFLNVIVRSRFTHSKNQRLNDFGSTHLTANDRKIKEQSG